MKRGVCGDTAIINEREELNKQRNLWVENVVVLWSVLVETYSIGALEEWCPKALLHLEEYIKTI